MSNASTNVTVGLSMPLTIILIVLKTSNIITCSWWLVFLPLYLGFLILLASIFLILAVGIIAELLKK